MSLEKHNCKNYFANRSSCCQQKHCFHYNTCSSVMQSHFYMADFLSYIYSITPCQLHNQIKIKVKI